MPFLPGLMALTQVLAGAKPLSPMEVRLPTGPHPCVFLATEEPEAVRGRALSQPWAQSIREEMLESADRLVAEALEIPRKGGQWTHWFSCNEDGGRLRSKSPTQHVCSVCGKVYSGYPYDQVYITTRHTHWLSGVETLGVAYALDPEPAYAERLREILLEYASSYEDLELHDVRGEKGSAKARLFSQTLDESVQLCRVCLGYDLAYDSPCFTKNDHKRIADSLLRPMVETIRANDRDISNWQSWHNAAVGSVGFLLRDKNLVDWAINGRSGFLFQMRRSVMSSGMWYEESPAYHWYALGAHVYLMEAAARAGIDLYGLPIVKKMFDAPMRQLLPDLTFAPLHDSTRCSIGDQRRFYEIAYRRFGDSAYLSLLEPRDSWWTLLWGAESIPEKPGEGWSLPTSSNCEVEGLAVLRNKTNDVVSLLDYGPGLSGHNQPAKLNVVLYAHDDIRLVDPGRLPYGNRLHGEWYRQTVAHNTVVVNEQSQARTGGKLKAFATKDDWAVIRATCETAYPGVLLDRTVLMDGNAVYDVFRCSAARAMTFDLPLHFRGTLTELPKGEVTGPLSNTNGYQHLKNLRRFTAPLGAFVVDTGQGNRICVAVFDDSEAFVGEGFGLAPTELLPVLLRRQRAKEAVFATLYQILGPDDAPAEATCEIGPTTTMRLFYGPDCNALTVGKETCVSRGGVSYGIGAGGLEGEAASHCQELTRSQAGLGRPSPK